MMSSVIRDSSTVKVKDGVDITKLSLTAQEGYLCSRALSPISVREVYQLSMLDQTSTAVLIKKLHDEGVLEIVETEKKADKDKEEEEARKKGLTPPKRDFGQFVFNLLELNEEVELSKLMKKDILFLYHNLDDLSYYELLALEPNASPEAVKAAFSKLSKLYHPDSYFRKNLGSFKPKMNAVYSKLALANSTLSNPKRRLAYRKELIAAGKIQPSFEDNQETDEERKARLAKAQKQARLKRNPLLKKMKKGQEFYESGLRDLEKENYVGAINNFRMALTFDRNNELFQAKATEAQIKVDEANAVKAYNRGLSLEELGQAGYFEAYEEAARLAPRNPKYNLKVAQLYYDQKDYELALPYAEKASRYASRNIENKLTLAAVFVKLKKKEEAQSVIQQIFKLDPENEAAKKLLKDARKWF